MKSLRKILGIVLVVGMLAAMMVPALASSTPRAEHKYQGDDSDHQPTSEQYLKDVTADSKITFKKFLVVPKGTQVPNAEFSFTIESGAAVAASASSMEVYPGTKALNGTLPVFTTGKDKATFAPGDATYDAVRTDANGEIDIDVKRAASDRKTGLTAATGVQWDSGQDVYAVVENLEINFTGVTFVEPGIYRYIIRETASATNEAAGIMHDNHTFRVLDVYVTDGNNDSTTPPTATPPTDAPEGRLRISGYVLHKGGTAPNYSESPNVAPGTDKGSADVTNHGDALGDKTDGFTNEYKPYDLVVKKEVTGNQASRDKYFEITVTIPSLTATDKFTVSLADDSDASTTDGYADATSGANVATIAANAGQTNKTEVTGAELATGVQFYLQHGQSIAIRGLPANAVYTVTENAEDYKSEGAKVTDHKNAVALTGTATIASENAATKRDGTAEADPAPDHVVYTSFLNTRDGVIPTGVIMTVAPGAAIILIAGIGFAVLMASKRRREEEAAE